MLIFRRKYNDTIDFIIEGESVKNYPPDKIRSSFKEIGHVVEHIHYGYNADGRRLISVSLYRTANDLELQLEEQGYLTAGEYAIASDEVGSTEPKSRPDEGSYLMLKKKMSIRYWTKVAPSPMSLNAGDYIQVIAVYPTQEIVFKVIDGEYMGSFGFFAAHEWQDVSQHLKPMKSIPVQATSSEVVRTDNATKPTKKRELGAKRDEDGNTDDATPYVRSGSFARIKKGFPSFKSFKREKLKDFMATDLDDLEAKKKKERKDMMDRYDNDGGGGGRFGR